MQMMPDKVLWQAVEDDDDDDEDVGDVTAWLTKRLTDYTCICLGACVLLPLATPGVAQYAEGFSKLLTPGHRLCSGSGSGTGTGRLCACDKFGLLKGVSA